MTASDLHRRVFEVVSERGPSASRAIALAVGRRKAHVQAALRDLRDAGLIFRAADGWTATIVPEGESRPGTAGNRGPVAGNPDGDLTADALEAMTRPERIKALWGAMSPAGRERAWADLSTEQRADAVAALFDAREVRPPATFAGAIDAWQRRADR